MLATDKKYKKRLLTIMVIVLVMMTGCDSAILQEKSNELDMVSNAVKIDNETNITEEGDNTGERSGTEKDFAIVYQNIYEEIIAEGKFESTELMQSVINRLGEEGYSAVDNENQIDMVCPEQIKKFCGQVEAQEEAEAVLIVVMSATSLVRYEFTTKDGNVEVQRIYCQYKGDALEIVSIENYPAYTWVYSKEGYLFFEEYHMPGFDGPSGYTAVRVEPLDEICREFNRKYLRMVGYDQNNLFTSDWSEDDFRELNFYDLYTVLRQMKSGQHGIVDFYEEGVSYEIPRSEFESVFQTFFQIDGDVLQQHTVYHKETETYQYRERGMFDFAPTPNIPYPEVISYEENLDRTITLTVNAVWPAENRGKAFSHEVVIRLLEDGGFQYVSNHVIPSADNVTITWYSERLSDDEWKEYYGGLRKNDFMDSKEPISILTAEEERNLQDEAISAAKRCMELYKDVRISDAQTYYSYIEDFSDEQRKDVVKCLGGLGLVSVSDNINMENYQKMEEFYFAYASGGDAMVTVFDVHKNGNINVLTFIHREGKAQTYHVTIGWKEGGIPEIKDFGSNDLEEIKLTEKGYFIYTNTKTIAHGNLREYYRVKPLSDECREMTKKYIYGLSFVNYNMLVTNWDADNVEDILMPCMFEDIYRIYTREALEIKNGLISAEVYEHVMTTCFPVSVEQLRRCCGYRVDAGGYEYEMIFPRQFPPFGEVVDYKQNEDGTITLYVDGVWPDYNSDYAFTNQIVVQPFPDGTFRYLSNTVEQRELKLPRIEK